MAFTAAVSLLVSIFLFARWAGATAPGALSIMAALGFYYFHVRHPLFFYSLVDIEAFPVMLLAVWALLAGRRGLCLVLACVGLFFKEFLIVPALLVALEAVREWKRSGWDPGARRQWGFALLALGLASACVLAPRLLLPISHSFQLIDPLNRPESVTQLARKPLDMARDLNLAFALLCYWLPTLMLVTRERARSLWQDLGDWRLPTVVHLVLVFALALYGGSNVTTFVAYALPFEVLVLALLLKRRIPAWEVIVVLLAVFAFNKVPNAIPPLDGSRAALEAHVDFYTGWSSRVNAATRVRWVQLGLCLLVLPVLRRAARPR